MLPVIEPGSLLAGTYRIEALLGEGGMGAVYRAEHVRLGRKVAVKVLRGELTQSVIERFLLEARATARVAHRAVVEVFDVGEASMPYLAMELLRGETLAQRMERVGRIAPPELIELGIELCEGLAAAHTAGIVHRDLKPANIFLAEENGRIQPKILDFGVAQVAGESRLTAPGRILGTVVYLSPEQARAQRELDARSDLYTLGVIFFEALTGRLPFEGDSLAAMLLQQATEPAPPVERFAPQTPPALCSLLRSLLERERDARPSDAKAVLRVLETLRADGDHRAVAATEVLPAEVVPGVKNDERTSTREAAVLPAETTSFIGREETLAELDERFSKGARWVTLTGPVGVGKSRLALRFAKAISERVRSEKVHFVQVSRAEDEAQIATLVALALGLVTSDRDVVPVARVTQVLAASGALMLVLDGLDRCPAVAATLLRSWHAQLEHVRFLVTARSALNAIEEEVCVLAPLPRVDARALFLARARAAQPRFHPSQDELDSLERLLVALDCLPLAIELCASRLAVLSLAQLEARLKERWKLLTCTATRSSPLRAALDDSWSLLDEFERLALSQCAVFCGAFTLRARSHRVGYTPQFFSVCFPVDFSLACALPNPAPL